MSPAAESALERLDATRQKWWFFSLMTSTVLACSTSLAVLMTCMLADAYWQLSQTGLICLSVTWLAITGLLMLLVARRCSAANAAWRPPRGVWKRSFRTLAAI